jgi:acetyl-CoA carboxylase biotin carboxyl carrier protein
VDLKDLKEILRILEEQDVTEFELEQDGVKLRVCRASSGSPAPVAAPIVAPLVLPGAAPVPAPAAPQPGTAAAAAAAAAEAAASDADGTLVRSPIVGTFYRSPDPNSPPFVSVGDSVKVGQVLCIIEAMKLMNEIEAEMAGEVTKIHPENGQPVQYGDPLFTIRTA